MPRMATGLLAATCASGAIALAIASVTVTGALIFAVSQVMDVYIVATNLASLVGVGVAVDYSLFILARYRSDGSLDPTFGDQGKTVSNRFNAIALARQSDGKLLTLGSQSIPRARVFFMELTRFNPDGSLDPDFHATLPCEATGSDLLIQPDGKIVVGGAQPVAIAFDDMLDRLEDSFTRLSQFSADLAHELRTPLANIRGEAEVTLTRTRSPNEYVAVIESSVTECERLTGIIDNLLFLARAEAAGEGGRGGRRRSAAHGLTTVRRPAHRPDPPHPPLAPQRLGRHSASSIHVAWIASRTFSPARFGSSSKPGMNRKL